MILHAYQSQGLNRLLAPSPLDETPSAALLALSELVAHGEPDQPRDEQGRFAPREGGGPAEGKEPEAKKEAESEEERLARLGGGSQVLSKRSNMFSTDWGALSRKLQKELERTQREGDRPESGDHGKGAGDPLASLSQWLSKLLGNYSPDQPRDNRGRFAPKEGGDEGGEDWGSESGGSLAFSAPGPSGASDPVKSSFVSRALGAAAGRSEKAVAAATDLAIEVVGKSVYESLPHPLQKVVDIACTLEDNMAGYYKAGQRLAQEMALERNMTVRDVAAVGRILARSDAFIGHLGEVVGVGIGRALPVASLSYVAYSMARGLLSGRNPFTMVTAALDRVHKSLQ